MNELRLLVQGVESGRLLTATTFDTNVDEAIEGRDQPEFDSEWIRVYDAVQSIGIPADGQHTLDRLREVAFKRTFELTENPELAGCVSDDFGLFGAALFADVDDAWLTGLWIEYRNHRFPHGTILRIEGALRNMIE